MSELAIRPIADIVDALDMRLVRNEVRDYMTHNSKEITIDAQCAWYNFIYKHENSIGEAFGFLAHVDDELAGYGLITKRSGNYWLSAGLTESQRGHGYGEQLFRFLGDFVLTRLEQPVYLDVLNSNVPAKSLYEKLGYQAIEQTDRLTVMRLDRE